MTKSSAVPAIPEIIDGKSVFPIRTVSTITGVNAITLRAWERRYGLLKPLRTDSGHRLYTQEDIDLIQRVTELLEKGVSISQAKNKLNQEHAPKGAAETTEQTTSDQWRNYQRRMFNAVVRFDSHALDNVYNETLSLYPVDLVTRQLITPVLKTLGERWLTESGAVAEEHYFGIYLRNKMGARFHHHSANNRGPILIAACLPGEHHELGLMLFGLAALDFGFRVILLGADMPITDLVVPVARSGAAAIVLSGSVRVADETLSEQLRTLIEKAKVPVFIGGHSAVKYHDAILRAGAMPLGTDIAAGLKRIAAATHYSPQSPRLADAN